MAHAAPQLSAEYLQFIACGELAACLESLKSPEFDAPLSLFLYPFRQHYNNTLRERVDGPGALIYIGVGSVTLITCCPSSMSFSPLVTLTPTLAISTRTLRQ